jgi:hypothetical protein
VPDGTPNAHAAPPSCRSVLRAEGVGVAGYFPPQVFGDRVFGWVVSGLEAVIEGVRKLLLGKGVLRKRVLGMRLLERQVV